MFIIMNGAERVSSLSADAHRKALSDHLSRSHSPLNEWGLSILTFFVFVHAFLQGRVVHFGLGGRVGRAGTSLGTATRAAAGARVA